MKKQIKDCMIAGLFSLLSFPALSQVKISKTPCWVSERGYWVVETNRKIPLQHSIRFYTNENVLIGRKELTGIKLNIRRRKVKLMLKATLESSLVAWERAQENNTQTSLTQSKP